MVTLNVDKLNDIDYLKEVFNKRWFYIIDDNYKEYVYIYDIKNTDGQNFIMDVLQVVYDGKNNYINNYNGEDWIINDFANDYNLADQKKVGELFDKCIKGIESIMR